LTNSPSNSSISYARAVAELVLASVLWGAAFTLVKWALEDFSPSALVFWRFLLAFVLGEGILYLFFRENFKNSFAEIKRSIPAGICIGLSIILQTEGQIYITATNSGFITSLYVIIVPIVGGVFFHQKIQKIHYVLGVTAFIGMGLLLNIHNLNEFQLNKGDLLTFGCAVAAAFHITVVGRIAKEVRSPFRFNNYQNLWITLLVLPFFIYQKQHANISLWPAHVSLRSVIAVLILCFTVSMLAFFLQVRAQKKLNTTTASLLCLLEAPNAFLFAALFLNESLNLEQVAGVALILGSSALSVYLDRPQNSQS
jgi:drug/metabolite transporter (DMT)-like permease